MKTDVHVFLDSVLCVGNNDAIANEAWATELSEVWDPMTFKDKHHITGKPVQLHLAHFSGHTATDIMGEILTFLGSKIRVSSKTHVDV